MVVNVDSDSVEVDLNWSGGSRRLMSGAGRNATAGGKFALNSSGQPSQRQEYHFTGSMRSNTLHLNGHALNVNGDGTLPGMFSQGKHQSGGNMVVQSNAVAFAVFQISGTVCDNAPSTPEY